MASLTARALAEQLGFSVPCRVSLGQFANTQSYKQRLLVSWNVKWVAGPEGPLEDYSFRSVGSCLCPFASKGPPNSSNCFPKIPAKIRFVAFKIFYEGS